MHLRLALRRLAATPAFTVGAIAVLALGTGATVAVFTVLNALVLRALPVREPGRLIAIEVQNARGEPAALPRPLFETLSQRQRSLDHVTGVLGGSVVSADAGGTVHQAVVDGVTADYFQLLALPIVAGRPIGLADYRAHASDADPVAVISQGYASRMFGTPIQALGRAIILGETTVTVVGITADTFPGIQVGVRTDIVVPAPMVEPIIGLQPGSVPLRYVFGRLANGRSLEEVRAEWSGIWQSEMASAAAARRLADVGERRLVVTPGATGVSAWRSRYRGPLQLTMMASAWLIVIACVNLAGLQFARVLRREQEVAVSRALGATDWDVIAPTLLESLLLCLAGLLLSVPLAVWSARLALDLLSTGSVRLELDLTPDWSTWTMLAAVTVLVTVGAGLVPAWLATRRSGGLASASRVVVGHRHIGSVLVAGQVALAVVLLSGAALAVEALLRLALRDPGFDADRVVAAQLTNRPGGYAEMNDAAYYRTLVDRIASVPGVAAVALAKPVPGASSTPPIKQPVSASGHTATIDAGIVFASPGYLDVLGLSALAGRDITWRDDAGAPRVALISRALARDLMPGGFGEGLRIDVGSLPQHRSLEVVGIVNDASVLNVQDPAPRVVYVSALQQPPPMARWPGLLVRTRPSVASIEPAVARVLDGLGREFVLRTDTLSGHITRALARERLLAGMAVVYGVLAIAMVAIGLSALLAQDVTRRLREFGVRLSLGASPAMLYRSVTTRAARLTAAGVGIGTALTWMLTRVLVSTLGVDGEAAPWALAAVTVLLLIVAGCAAAGPARQAAKTEPMAALRGE
jgi:predicted permease